MGRPLKEGEIIGGRYQITQQLGRGAAAHVYAARALEPGDGEPIEVAVKILDTGRMGDAAAMSRFSREAELQAVVRHKNVAALYASGVTRRGEPFIAIELLRGRSLRDVVKADGYVAPTTAASYCWQALQGLAATHAEGVLHRDIKPANLMLEPSPGPIERVVLIDFGFASLEGGARLTARGHVVGSLGYLAPERLLGEPADTRSDQYSVGIVLFELIAGRRPFVADADLALVHEHVSAEVPMLIDVIGSHQVPPELENVIRTALSKRPTDRFESAEAMAAALAMAAQVIRE